MIKIENTEVFGWEAAIRGMRNPMNSWEMSDSGKCHCSDGFEDCKVSANSVCPRYDYYSEDIFCVGARDFDLMKRLVKGGSEHSKFMRMIHVQMDVTAPLYWWKEADTYKVGTVANSCSTMHTLHKKELKLEDFSIDTFDLHQGDLNDIACVIMPYMNLLEGLRRISANGGHKEYWRALIQLLPSSYNQRRTLDLNYAILRKIYHQRKSHKLDEWHYFCHWIESLPYSELITMGGRDE